MKLLRITQDHRQAFIEIPKADRSPVDTVIVLMPQGLGR
jgi:hypothetical protein